MRFIAGAVFAAIVVCGISLQFVARAPAPLTGYDRFLIEVDRRMPAGTSIAIYAPASRFEPGYAFSYYRAVYRLPGRRVVPLKDPDDRDHPERMAQVDYIAAWDAKTALPHTLVWRGEGGTLYRRAR